MNMRRRLGMHDRYHDRSEKSQRHKALLVAREAIILESESRALEHSGRIDEVQPMVLQVETDVSFRPRKTAYATCIYTAHVRQIWRLRPNDRVERPATMRLP